MKSKRRHTTPRRTREKNTVRRQFLQLVFYDMKAVALKPSDLVLDSVYFGIMLCTLQDSVVILDGVHTLPFPGLCKGNGVSARSCKCVDENTAP